MKLRKITLPTLLLTLCAFQAFAQFSIGLRGGIHLGDFALKNVEGFATNPESRLGGLFGVVSEIRLNDNFAIQPELNFIQKGSRQELSLSDSLFGDIDVKAEVILNYLELPVLFKFGGNVGSMVRVDALAGPGFGYALNGKFKNVSTVNGETESENEAIDFDKDELSRTDVSIHVGGMLTLKAGEAAKIFVDGRYIIGLTNLNTSNETNEARNRGGSFSAGVLFTL